MARAKSEPEVKQGAPAWMVSFSDMMTLVLCFFILLVSMSQEQNYGLLAKGVGSFIVAIESYGLNGILDGQEKKEIFDNVRRRFSLPPEEDPERGVDPLEASHFELIQAQVIDALEPHDELRQPNVATFEPDSAALTAASMQYLDALADTLRPGPSQVLMLEGHAQDAGARFEGDDAWLAFMRAEAVRSYLVEEHRFRPGRVQAKGWLSSAATVPSRSVDARLITPRK